MLNSIGFDDGPRSGAGKKLADGVGGGADDDGGAVLQGFLNVLQFGVGAVCPLAGCAVAKGLVILHVFDQFLNILAADHGYEGVFVLAVQIDALGGSHNKQGLRLHQAGDLGRRLIVVHALHNVGGLQLQVADLKVPGFLTADCVVVVDDGYRPLRHRASQQGVQMLAFFGVVEVLMLHEDLSDRIFGVDELAVSVHKDGLSLRAVIGLDGFVVALDLLAVPFDIVQPAHFHRAGRDPNITGTKVRGNTRHGIVA